MKVAAALALCGHADLAEAVQDLVNTAIQLVHGITPVSHQSHVTAGTIPVVVAVFLANVNCMRPTVALFGDEENLIMHDEPHARGLGVRQDRWEIHFREKPDLTSGEARYNGYGHFYNLYFQPAGFA
jgi:hypothetical protein